MSTPPFVLSIRFSTYIHSVLYLECGDIWSNSLVSRMETFQELFSGAFYQSVAYIWHNGAKDWHRITSWTSCSVTEKTSHQKPKPGHTYNFTLHLRLMSWWMMLLEWRYSIPRRTCLVTQMISNSLMGPQLSTISRTEPPSPASMNRWTLLSQSRAPYSSAMFSWRNRAWNSTSAALKCSTGICMNGADVNASAINVFQNWLVKLLAFLVHSICVCCCVQKSIVPQILQTWCQYTFSTALNTVSIDRTHKR